VLPGVFDRDNHPSEHAVNTWAPEPDLDDLPIPDYSGFFEQIGLVSDLDIGEVLLPFETSRGCWWGAKSHCTFCGLNGSSMRYRQKTPSRAIAELRQIKAQSPHGRLTAVDNILSLEYFESVLPALAREGVGPLFYEVKANLRRPHIVRLREAGISEIQPGIESFSDTSLRRMAKGTSSIQNASLLKMCKEEGVRTVWNLLYGFPGETVEDYQQQLAVIPHLAHLEPPVGYGPVRIDRFSPMHSHPEKFGISRLEPVPIYEHLYPGLSSAARYNLAYYFEGDFPEKTSFGTERSELERQIESWKAHHVYAFLTMLDVDRTKVLIDTRSPASPSVYRLHEGEVRFFEQSRDLNSWEEMQRCAHSNVGAAGQQLLDRYLSRGILLRSGSRAASLVTYCDKVGEVCAALIALRARDAHSLTGTQSIRVPTDILHKLETA
jgi:ribosomal peptide maturation radical SAM protein 1